MIQSICNNSYVPQWHYFPTAYNPADNRSRGLDAIKQDLILQLEGRLSSWGKLQKIKQKKAILTSNIESTDIPLLDIGLLQEASNSMIKLVQIKHFKDGPGKLKQKKEA